MIDMNSIRDLGKGKTKYTFGISDSERVIVTTAGGGASAHSEGLKKECGYCHEDDCVGDCTNAKVELDANGIKDHIEERQGCLAYNSFIDGVESMLMGLCTEGLVNESNIEKHAIVAENAISAASNAHF